MASPIAHAPHNGPVDTPGEGAYLYARSGIARSATTRSNFLAFETTIDWIVRDIFGNVISTTDLSGVILQHSLRVTQAINDEPDTCSFTLRPQEAPALVPKTGDEIRISAAPGAPALFHGYVLVTQADWQLRNQQPPWIAVQCQDPLWRFDARIVNYRFPAQSVTDSIAFLVTWFCNTTQLASNGLPIASPLDFNTAFVQAGMPSLPAFDVVNQRPSTVMRTLTASVGGGFYLEGLTLHAWANSVSEPHQTNPTPLTVGLKTLHSVRRTEDATQVRRRVIVEGRRTSITTSLPAVTTQAPQFLGVPVEDASFIPDPPEAQYTIARLGTQWIRTDNPITVTANGANPPQTQTQLAFAVGDPVMGLKAVPFPPPAVGWIRIGNQYALYKNIGGDTAQDNWAIYFYTPADGFGPVPYGVFTVPIDPGETVEWVDNLTNLLPHGLTWPAGVVGFPGAYPNPAPGDPYIRSHPTNTPLVALATAEVPADRWPMLEGFVQDGRYSYAGAQARATSDLAAFQDPLIAVEWSTDDLNAIPGRAQVIDLSSETITPPIQRTVTILRVEISFPLRTLPPRRACTGGYVKPSSFLDLVVTTQN